MIIKTIMYAFIILIANTLGAISGMGGGVIIKPALQILGLDTAITINFYACIAVLVMSISSTCKQIKSHNAINKKAAIYIGLGSVFGGILGNTTFKNIYRILGDSRSVAIQMILLILSLIFALYVSSGKIKTLSLKGNLPILLTGIFLGWISTFLGIGGGPINTACFILFFGISVRDATIYSIITIFFSQASKLVQMLLTNTIPTTDIFLIISIIITAIVGGWLGATISNRISQKDILKTFRGMIVVVMVLGLTNLCNIFII